MKLIIDIDKEVYDGASLIAVKSDLYRDRWHEDAIQIPLSAISNGIPIPDNATNGDVVMTMFPNEQDFETDFDWDWWNEPYQKGGKGCN